MGRDPSSKSEGIFNSAQAITVELVGDRPRNSNSGHNSLVEHRVCVLDVQIDACSAQALSAPLHFHGAFAPAEA